MPAAERRPRDVIDGRYRLVERLGQGGFGDVWRAQELLPDGKALREVALKLLRAPSADWTEEARIIASLRHPALVTVYAAGLADASGEALPFVAMELLTGENLAAFVDRGQKIAWRRVLSWAREAAAALDAIHRAGVVHLDLKPANLFLCAAGDGAADCVKVLDFGIARQGERRAEAEATGDEGLTTAAFIAREAKSAPDGASSGARTVVGTPGFMAPEVIEGGEPTAAADAYALAACTVQLITGHLPQQVERRPESDQRSELQRWLSEVQTATLHGRLRELSGETLPTGLREMCLRWLRLDPRARGAEAGSLRAQLDAVWCRPHGVSKQPFRGLAPMTAADEGNIYGRAGEIDRLGRELCREHALVLSGAPASGLTSLALAGLVPELGREAADGLDDWRACCVRLGDDPSALAAALDVELGASEGGAIERILLHAEKTRVGLALVIEDLPAARGRQGSDSFSTELSAVIKAAIGGAIGLRVIGLAPEERIAEVGASELGRPLQPFFRYVGPVPASAAEELVRGPAEVAGVTLVAAEPAIADIKAELQRDGASLPAISLALTRWWQGPLNGERWQAQGGVVGPLCEHAERALADMAGDFPHRSEQLLLRLMRADGRAVELDQEELLAASDDREAAELALAALLAARIVAAQKGKLRLAHPALAHRWPRLHDRRLHNFERLSALEELRAAAARWRSEGRGKALLWDAAHLADIERKAPGARAEIGPDERAFLAACGAARTRGRWLRAAIGVVVLALLCIGVATGHVRVMYEQNQERALARAQRAAAIGSLVTLSRRTNDPYHRIALLAAAIDAGSADPLLPLELLSAARDLPPAQFLSLDPVQAPRFPWDGRYLLAATRSQVLLFDFDPDEGAAWGPVGASLMPHADGLYDVEPMRFGHGFITRGLSGQLRVWRRRENREIALAAQAPMRCLLGLTRVLVAARAPVIACATAEGLARWDLRHPDRVDRADFAGRLLDISPDGRWLAAARPRRLALWRAGSAPVEMGLPEEQPAAAARFSPRDAVVAVVEPRRVQLLDLSGDAPAERMDLAHAVSDPSEARFSEGGLDLAVCDHQGNGRWHYLRPARKGARDPDDGPQPDDRLACLPQGRSPARLERARDYGESVMAAASVGPRIWQGGFKLADGRTVTRDLVTFKSDDTGLSRLVSFSGSDRAARSGESAVAVARDGETVVWQTDESIRGYRLDGTEQWRRPGNLLGRCPDRALLSWRKASETRWELFDARDGRLLGQVAREEGFVLGADSACRRVFFQWLDGRLASVEVAALGTQVVTPTPIDPGAGGYSLDGYVFDARWSAGAGSTSAQAGAARVEPGLWLGFSSGAMARADATGQVRSYGHANGRLTAMADGPIAGDLLFADDDGVALRSRHAGRDRRIVAGSIDRAWSDALLLPGAAQLLLASAHHVAMVDVGRAELLGEIELRERGRLALWDEQGSTLVWSSAFAGPPRGDVIPIGRDLAMRVGAAASNLRAELGHDGRARLQLR